MSIRLVKPGAFTTIQDLGRPSWGSSGVPPSGAFDQLSLRAANLLVGNDEDAAGLEFTMNGPELLFDEPHECALTGARFDALLGAEPVETGRSFRVPAGATLTIGGTRDGVRGYIAVSGGIDVDPVLGSRSTLVSAGFGGLDGRALVAGVVIPIGTGPERGPRVLRDGGLPSARAGLVLRAIPGPQEETFTDEAMARFYSEEYRVSPRADRAGVRLDGPPLALTGDADIDPEGVVTGAVQVPADGLPIVLGPDRPATGGYAKIATVIAADVPLLAQARPGATLRFARTTIEEARTAWRERSSRMRNAVEDA